MQQEFSPQELDWIQDQVRKGPQPHDSRIAPLVAPIAVLVVAAIVALVASNTMDTREAHSPALGPIALVFGALTLLAALLHPVAKWLDRSSNPGRSHSMTALRGGFEEIVGGGRRRILFNGIPCAMPTGWDLHLPIREVVVQAAETGRDDRFLVVVEIEGIRSLRQDLERGMASIRPGRARKTALWGLLLVASTLPLAASGAHYGWSAWSQIAFGPREPLVVERLADLDRLSPPQGREVQLPPLVLKYHAPRPPENRSNLVGYTQSPSGGSRDSLDTLLAGLAEVDEAREHLNSILPGNLGDRIVGGSTVHPLLEAIERQQAGNPTIWVTVVREELQSLVYTQIALESFPDPKRIFEFLTSDRGAPKAIVIGKSSKGWMFQKGSRSRDMVSVLVAWLGLVALLAPLLWAWSLVQWRRERRYLQALEAMAD